MKMAWLASLLLTLPSLSLVHGFPTAESFARLAPSETDIHKALVHLREKRQLANFSGQPIDVTGQHEFIPPNFDAGDQRGPCPGLNALANHGYLPRDGVAGFFETIAAVNQVFGMGIDLGTVIAAMGTVWTGNPLSLDPGFSIGGESDKVQNLLGFDLLGTPRGLNGSHNLIEADASMTRDDLYVTGDASTLNLTLFEQTYNSVDGDTFGFDEIAEQAGVRFEQSKATNPYFYYGPLTGMVVRNAGLMFAARLLSNHSAEYPQGQMTKEVFKSFWGVYDDASAEQGLVYKRGWERIPNNWYRIPVDYGLVSLNLDLLLLFSKKPELLSIGGNTGTVNSFAGVDMSDLLGGVINTTTLLEGNNLICFVLEIVKTVAPNSLSSLFQTLDKPLQFLSNALVGPLIDLSCPVFGDLEAGGTDLLAPLTAQFPGASRANSAL
ncbi:uncharacterized protein PV09_07064 [Verruconis gallopava]|uniref:Heme haloperoxidase family profile domain-containing protein n=1 Tax=Verruconis gallopava TaxID=253628 RepID=A0A0D1YLA5_9PEZI|nr:uncharacterized protein PV09_07064 [Verruconis gallopava]KIW01592.1 hypothetical protein PV09_07064 [Verruconis gallopava]